VNVDALDATLWEKRLAALARPKVSWRMRTTGRRCVVGLRGRVPVLWAYHIIFLVIEPFRYLLRLRRYKRKSVEVGVFRTGLVTLSADFRGKGRQPPTAVGISVAE